MKTVLLSLILLFCASAVQSQKNLLVATILLEGTNTPAPGVEILIMGRFHQPLTTLTTDPDGKIRYATNQTSLNLNIRSNDLNFKSTFEQLNLAPGDTSLLSITLIKRDPIEADRMKRGLQKLPEEKNPTPYTCTDYTQQNLHAHQIDSCLTSQINYPEKAREFNLTAKIRVKFIIDKTGQVCNIELLDQTYTILEEEVIRAASLLTDMPVAICKGKKFPPIIRFR
ncbi:energy transducer TonB [Fluviicola sp.]|uniref:energy transducer TonB n=1 Tax=Fluviicola sp. TaxID=1917219 RepID=UPI003D2C6A1D